MVFFKSNGGGGLAVVC